MLDCLNCQTAFQGHYCPECGQPASVKRLSLSNLSQDFLLAILNTDRGLWRTLIDLAKHPGHMLRAYLQGRRQIYMSAGKYTLLWAVIFTLMSSFIESQFGFFQKAVQGVDRLYSQNWQAKITSGEETTEIKSQAVRDPVAQEEWLKKEVHINLDFNGKQIDRRVTRGEALRYLKFLLPRYHDELFAALNYLLIIWIPLAAIGSFLFFWGQPLNFAEHLTLNSFIYAEMLSLSSVLMALFWLIPSSVSTSLFALFTANGIYLLYAYWDIFQTSRWKIVRILGSVTMTAVLYMAALMSLLIYKSIKIAVDNIEML